MDDQLQVVPAIAKSWTISEDGKTYTCGDGSGSISISTSSGNIKIGMIE